MSTFHDLTPTQLKQAVQYREQIESLQEKLDALLGGSSTTTKTKRKVGRPAKVKRTMSPAGRAAIAAAQQARWAKIKGKSSTKVSSKKSTSAKSPVKTAPKKKVMSPEAKAKIAAAMKARWEAKKKGAMLVK